MIYQVMADDLTINAENVKEWLRCFNNSIAPMRRKHGEYYDGVNCVIKQGAVEGRPNYSINVNMAKYIVDVSTAYAFSIPIVFSTTDESTKTVLEKIDHINKNCNYDEIDLQQGGDLATYGVSYQLVMALDNNMPIEDRIVFKHLEPLQTFMVIDNSILKNLVCGVYFYCYKEKGIRKKKIYVYDDFDLYIFVEVGGVVKLESIEPHNMGFIPIIESLNNDDAFSDIQCVTDLLDALSLAISNNTDNLQSIANAILAISGGTLTEEQIKEINQYKVANMPVGAAMNWIIKNINPEAEKMQIDNLLKFLFQISQVPDLTDDAFGGNQSGVAMQYKLWGLDQLWATKTKKYKKSVLKRLKIILHLLQYQFESNVDLINKIDITFSKNLPQDNTDLYQMVNALKDILSKRTILKQVPFVEDVEAELEELDKEAEKNADLYGFNNNQALNGGDNAEEEQ